MEEPARLSDAVPLLVESDFQMSDVDSLVEWSLSSAAEARPSASETAQSDRQSLENGQPTAARAQTT
jgi:hypothetical protein